MNRTFSVSIWEYSCSGSIRKFNSTPQLRFSTPSKSLFWVLRSVEIFKISLIRCSCTVNRILMRFLWNRLDGSLETLGPAETVVRSKPSNQWCCNSALWKDKTCLALSRSQALIWQGLREISEAKIKHAWSGESVVSFATTRAPLGPESRTAAKETREDGTLPSLPRFSHQFSKISSHYTMLSWSSLK